MGDLRILVMSSIPPHDDRRPGKQWSHLAELTCATQKKYCDLHGYDYHLDVSSVRARVGTPWVNEPPSGVWAPVRTMIKFRLFNYFLDPDRCRQEYDAVVWLDADCLVTNYELPIEKWLNSKPADMSPGVSDVGDLVLAWDVNGLHPTVIMMRRTRLTQGLSWACSEAGERMWMNHDWSDIMAARFFIATPPYNRIVWHITAKDLCAMPPGVHPMPAAVNDDYAWTPESWTLHLSALTIEKRIEIAQDYVARYNLL